MGLSQIAIEDLTNYEMLIQLQRLEFKWEAWIAPASRSKKLKEAIPIGYTNGASKVYYTTRCPSKFYLMAMLKADDMLKRGLPIVMHGQKDAWYKSVLDGDFSVAVAVAVGDDCCIDDVEPGEPSVPDDEVFPRAPRDRVLDDPGLDDGGEDAFDDDDGLRGRSLEEDIEKIMDEMMAAEELAEIERVTDDMGDGDAVGPPPALPDDAPRLWGNVLAPGDETPQLPGPGPGTPPLGPIPEGLAEGLPPDPPPPVPLPGHADDELVEECLKSGYYGCFRLTARQAGVHGGSRFGAFEARCYYHKKNFKTGCAKSFRIEGPTWADRHLTVKRAIWWFTMAREMDRQWQHMAFEARPDIDGALPTAEELLALKMGFVERPDPKTILNDEQWDEIVANELAAKELEAAAAG